MDGTGTAVHVEVILLRLDGGRLHYRCTRCVLPGGAVPDDLALELAGAADKNGEDSGGMVCHSTSWRHQHGVVVLTYAVVADPSPHLPAVTLTTPAVVCSADPTRPTPSDLHAHHIAAHAVRHLAYLADTDPTVAAAADAPRTHDLWKVIRAVGRDIPAGVHATAHSIAKQRTGS